MPAKLKIFFWKNFSLLRHPDLRLLARSLKRGIPDTDMKNTRLQFLIAAMSTLFFSRAAQAHDTDGNHSHDFIPTNALPVHVELKGPVSAPAKMKLDAGTKVSGQGFWRFVAVPDLMPLPPEVVGKVTPAHGTLIVDGERDIVYWGLKKVGWVGFSNRLRNSWVVQGDEQFTHNNMHGADLWPRKGKLPLVSVADDEGGKIYLTDTSFQNSTTLGVSDLGSYATNKSYKPTDVAFVGARRLFVTDGYAQHYFLPVGTAPLKYEGAVFGGNALSRTPHGITYDAKNKSLLISARPEGQAKRWSVSGQTLKAVDALPVGTLLCDVDLWKDYALAACLDGPNKTPGPLMIVNLKTRTIASIVRPKEELGYDFCDHIHDAAWYVVKNGRKTDVYLLFTAWNPGGVGALKLVNPGS